MGSNPMNDTCYGSSDTVSETTTTSRSSSIDKFRLPDGYVKEKLKVDRRKLEAMILRCPPDPWETEVMKIPISSDGRVMSIDEFFQRIMDITSTEIKYPKFLEVGARNKKDPHIHITGTHENVEYASQLVSHDLMPQLKVIMKMDVPWTCHSHIIGKGGGNIQSISRRTGVSIHFPDGNKNSEVQKCNQVSINSRGQDLNGLESARSAIREFTPLTFSFALPATAEFIRFPVLYAPQRLQQEIESKYNVQVTLQLVDCTGFIQGSVKGLQSDSALVMEATFYVLQALCGTLAAQISVETTLEISEQFHDFVLGDNCHNIKRIMQKTSTVIHFPDIHDPELCSLKRSTITIRGGIDNVYSALQKVIGSLPIVIMFDLPPDHQMADHIEIFQLRQTLNVGIDIRSKRADGRCSVKIRGEERNARNIYEAWRQISRLECPAIKIKVPLLYHLDDLSSIPSALTTSPFECCEHGFALDNILSRFPAMTPPTGLQKQTIFNNNLGECCFGSGKPESPGSPPPLSPSPLPAANEKDYKMASPPLLPFEVANGGEDQKSFYEAIPDRRAVGIERKIKHYDYSLIKALGLKAMKEPVTQPRTPTTNWSGYGLSKSMPGFNLLRGAVPQGENGLSSSIGNSSIGHDSTHASEWTRDISACSTYEPFSGLKQTFSKPQTTDVASVLAGVQMEQYIDLFSNQDIDLDLFLSLTDYDLKELGINVFGHRKKLLLTIKNISLERESEFQAKIF